MTHNSALVIAPHQDDETIGCGGLISILSQYGYKVFVVHVFCGSSGTNSGTELKSQKKRQKEACDASKILNFTLLPNMGYLDRCSILIQDLQKKIIKLIRKIKPMIILAPHSQEHDQEHRLVSKASWEASWLSVSSIFPKLGAASSTKPIFLGYEVWTPIKQPNLYIDITKTKSFKKKALKCYTSQIKNTNWVDASLGLNSYRGATLNGRGLVEVFSLQPSNIIKLINIFQPLIHEISKRN